MELYEKTALFLSKANETTGNADTTLADGIKSLIDGYGQGGGSNIVDITPVLTEDSPRVITNAPVFYANMYKWYVFDNDDDNYAYLDEIPYGVYGYLGYNFESPQNLIAVKVLHVAQSNIAEKLRIIASNDGVNWDTLTGVESIGVGNSNWWHTFIFAEAKTYSMFAVQFGEYYNYAKIGSIRFLSLQ